MQLGKIITITKKDNNSDNNNNNDNDDDDEQVALSAIQSSLSCDPYNYAALLWLGRFYSKKYLVANENNTNKNSSSSSSSVLSPLSFLQQQKASFTTSNNNNNNNNSTSMTTIKSRLSHATQVARCGEYLIQARKYFLQALHAHPFEAECYDAFGDYLGTCIEDIPSAIRSYRHALGCTATLRSAQQKQIQEKIMGYVFKLKERFDEKNDSQ